MLTHGNGLDCGLFMSGSAARGRGTRPRGGTRPPPYAPQPEVIKPKAVEPAPSKKLKKRVIKDTND